ncbi:efflux RND transporter periplasmic adaptor subunit [Pukyongiella litopenaei]|uniref:Efflux transporter periplasmic adaptor subunit n=1 Tax=Pukyongiella litopenaei TaxID=2605946 RepID=A0A2S0MRP8_9RHOB|nr:efflux transporter periplasmic adaptor subunit [Pukyongiella litopenaei]AVO38373.1 efflux transporter periplasmic adaptor subunit [Pukyongiella litopenaei]
MRFLRQSLIGILLASLTLALLIYAGTTVMSALQDRMNADRSPPAAQERVFTVAVRAARMETVVPEMRAFGEIQSRRSLELRAAAGGRVIALSENFDEGGTVRAGEVLLRIDPADAQAALEGARADLMDAEAEERDAERSLALARDELDAAVAQTDLRQRALQRQQDLQSRGVGTAALVEGAELVAAQARATVLSRRQALAQAEARIDQAATRLARMRIALDAAQRDLDDTVVTAGFDGTLSDVTLVEGRLVSVNEKLAMLVDPMALDVAIRVSTAQYARLLDPDGRLIPAQVEASLDVTGTDLLARGRLSRDGAAAGEGQSGRLVFARLENAAGFKPGDFVTVSVEEPALERVVRLPASALDASGTVLAVGPDDRLEAIPVTMLRRQGDDVLLRGDGLEGREIVIGRTPLLGVGIRVRPLREQAATGADAAGAMLELSAERRARLVAFVESSERLPPEAKARVLNQLEQSQVPEGLVTRLESRMGG